MTIREIKRQLNWYKNYTVKDVITMLTIAGIK